MNTEEILNQFKDLDELKELYLEYVDKLELKIGVRSLELFIKDVFITKKKVDKRYSYSILSLSLKDGKVFKHVKNLTTGSFFHEEDSIEYILYAKIKILKLLQNTLNNN